MEHLLSTKKRLEIANICYANVSSQFAMFTNEKNRSPNFSWDWFVDWCERQGSLWMIIHAVKGNRSVIDVVAAQYAKEIAERLLDRAGLKQAQQYMKG